MHPPHPPLNPPLLPDLISLKISLNLQTLTQDTVKPRFYGLMRKHNFLLENVPYSKRHKFYLLYLQMRTFKLKLLFCPSSLCEKFN